MNKANVFTAILGVVLVAAMVVGYFMFAKPFESDSGDQTALHNSESEEARPKPPADIESLEGVSALQKEHLQAVRELKEFIKAHPEGGPEVATAFTRLHKEYYRFPSQAHFDEIFYGEPDLFSHLVAEPDAKPSQLDVSFLNLWKFSAENYNLNAEAEINIANEMINLQPEIYKILSEYCSDLSIGVTETCNPPVEKLLSADQIETFNQLVVDVKNHLDNVDVAVPALLAAGDLETLTRVYVKRTRVMHKMRLFGLTTPGEIMASAIKTTTYAEKAGNVEKQIDAQIDYALVVTQLLYGTEGYQDTVASILEAIYHPDGKLNSKVGWYSRKLARSYELVASGQHTQGNHMDLLGTTQLALVDPGFKRFLELNVGFDFDSPVMQPYIDAAIYKPE